MKYSFTFNGWLGRLADDFTYRSVYTLGHILVNYFKHHHTPGQKIVIGYDTRYFAKEFAEFLAFIMASHELKTFISNKPAPSSVLVSTSLYKKSMGTIVLTADEHDARFLGVRAYDNHGFALNPEMLAAFSEVGKKYEGHYEPADFQKALQKGLIEPYDPLISYLRHVDKVFSFRNNHTCINRTVFNPLHGSGMYYFGDVLEKQGLIGQDYDYQRVSDFNRREPVPSQHVDLLAEDMLREGCELGFMVSPDCSTFQFLIGPHRLSHQEVFYLIGERLHQDGLSGHVLLSDDLSVKTSSFERIGLTVQTVRNKQFQQAIRQRKHLVAMDQFGRVYFPHHGAADALLVGYYLVEMFNDRSLSLAKIDQKVKLIKEMV